MRNIIYHPDFFLIISRLGNFASFATYRLDTRTQQISFMSASEQRVNQVHNNLEQYILRKG